MIVYSTCTYLSASSCTGRDLWYRSFLDGVWSGPVLFGPTVGEQLDVSAIAPGSGGTFHAVWLGRSQAGPGEQIFFTTVPIVS